MNIAIILSGGIGSRVGQIVPKQYIIVKGKPLIFYCLDTFSKNSNIDLLVVCLADEWKDFFYNYASVLQISKPIVFSAPGSTRQHTIYNALKVLDGMDCKKDDVVIIHDAARPLVTDVIINDCIEGCKMNDGILPVIPVRDTIYESEDSINITNLLNRNKLFAGQSPESFKFGKYLAAHYMMSDDEISKISGSTEIAYKCGLKISLIRGDEMNFKITTLDDLYNFENIINNEG